MKKIILFATLCIISLNVFAQKKGIQDTNEYTFYGVDFSQVNVIGAEETKDKFITAFNGIEQLLNTESKKYDLGKFAKIKIKDINTDIAKKRIELLENKSFLNSETNSVDPSKYVEIYGKNGGYGVIIIAQELNKKINKAKYVYIFFDGSNGKIIKTYEKEGKPSGFGLRNFWAGSLLDSMK